MPLPLFPLPAAALQKKLCSRMRQVHAIMCQAIVAIALSRIQRLQRTRKKQLYPDCAAATFVIVGMAHLPQGQAFNNN